MHGTAHELLLSEVVAMHVWTAHAERLQHGTMLHEVKTGRMPDAGHTHERIMTMHPPCLVIQEVVLAVPTSNDC